MTAPQLHGPKLHFRGVRGVDSLERLASATGLLTSENTVFMSVCSMHLGRRLQTKQHGHLEKAITRVVPGMQVVARMLEQNLHVRLRMVCKKVTDWPEPMRVALGVDHLGFPKGDTPTSLHIRIAFHGHVQLRLGFANAKWTQQTQDATLALCHYLAAQILKCC